MNSGKKEDFKIAFVGAGNVATHLAVNLCRLGYNITRIVARTAANAKVLADRVGAVSGDNVADIEADTDFVIISTTDKAVAEVAAALPHVSGVVAHTSGSVPLDVLAGHHKRSAVIYPLQTFSRNTPVDMSRVPFFTEATDKDSLSVADAVVSAFGGRVMHAGSTERAGLHIAGVFACNFPVYMLEMARQALEKAGLPFDTVRPLVDATVEKVFALGPMQAMTGPARRGDTDTIKKQLLQLSNDEQRQIYKVVSDAIFNYYNSASANEGGGF